MKTKTDKCRMCGGRGRVCIDSYDVTWERCQACSGTGAKPSRAHGPSFDEEDPFKTTTVQDLLNLPPYDGKTATIEEMNEAIAIQFEASRQDPPSSDTKKQDAEDFDATQTFYIRKQVGNEFNVNKHGPQFDVVLLREGQNPGQFGHIIENEHPSLDIPRWRFHLLGSQDFMSAADTLWDLCEKIQIYFDAINVP